MTRSYLRTDLYMYPASQPTPTIPMRGTGGVARDREARGRGRRRADGSMAHTTCVARRRKRTLSESGPQCSKPLRQ